MVTSEGDLGEAAAGQPPEEAGQFEATVIWMSDEPLLGGRGYLMKLGAATVGAIPGAPEYRIIDANTFQHLAAKTLGANDIGAGNLALGVDRAARARHKGQRPALVWLTGLPGAGKSTIANLLDRALFARGRHTCLLDGDHIRRGLNRDLGFTAADRVESVRRVAEVARLMVDAGLIVIVSMISPYRRERRMARELFAAGEFIEVFVDAPLALAEQRDPKGLYRKARRGELKNFTGIDAPYEEPQAPELRLDTAAGTPETAVHELLSLLRRYRILDS